MSELWRNSSCTYLDLPMTHHPQHRCPNSFAGFFFQPALSAPRSEETHGSPNAPLSVCSARIVGKIKEATRDSKRIIVSGLHQQESLRNKQVSHDITAVTVFLSSGNLSKLDLSKRYVYRI
ncbi:hypothetical protein KOW79_021281 [Hemibagrus wyckioides]|uniref:Uncharacterized protein n=1 Tax=Hemibagrus wyckioides TaxID=337641 RepID=A0A9D3N5H2_9TELE|nr:hypothetical protein KOW79_021281 [Hemibagrus wyckioides]